MTTQDCGECGTRAEPGQSFCDACGAVLRWDQAGRRTCRPAAADAGAGRAASARPGGSGPAPAPVGTDVPPAPSGPPGSRPAGAAPEHPGDRDGARTTGASRPAPNAPDLEDTAPDSPPLRTPADSFPPDGRMADRARSLVVPVTDPEATPPVPFPAVAPVLPGRPDTDRPVVRAPGPQQGTVHGPSCPWCTTPNPPDRHFCRHCAMPLAENGAPAPTQPGHRPWWRRLFGPGRHEIPWAGDRPRLRRAFDRIGTWITAAIAVALLVLGVLYVPDGIQAVRDHFAERAPVEPDGIRASRSYPGHGPKLAFDKLNNTWWGPGVSESGQGEWIEVSFAHPTRLLDLIITPGVSTRADQLGKSALPHRVKATITTKDGGTTTRELTLDPAAGGQRRAFSVGEVTRVRFTIESAHAASADKQLAIAEIELFGRSGGDQS
ncbi:NADase-type glycan-binding domain-containing protein [Streptomyces endophytica]|uniref:Zinc ribbon domain-containing protein n=1 Tax=Streptomyces endophytica TaxID=2991496 RepID=A0ABY6PID9_9ACTN|nr:zinc ribbon domain-containing protein [Streptomyces endophytica]UZJ33576.1 zinc ribbon domain-containing protein [Streptomyces endophytica]